MGGARRGGPAPGMAAMGRAGRAWGWTRAWARSQPCALPLAAALAVCAFYYLGGGGETFSSATRRLRATPPAPAHRHPQRGEAAAAGSGGRDLHLLLMFTKAERSPALPAKAQAALRSLLRHGRLGGGEALHLHLVTEGASRDIGLGLLRDLLRGAAFRHQVIVHDVNELTEKLFPIVEAMQKHFSAGSGTYYSDSIFFLSVAMHRIMPKEITQIIQVDLDLKYKTNIRDLFDEFNNFPEGAVIGIAREMQPVYRHTFWQYRRENPQTKVGDPPPDGLPGFNSGVLLLNLEAMRQSKLYNQLLEPAMVQKLTEKYHFKGHLGDQDFFTMVGMEHPELFHVLDCTWNRQLCTWWRDHGYSDVFDQYFQCEGEVRIYHGNCNTPIPED
ncbi:xyloside xylosyltransferase 1 [Phalacrocorax aristotelis]|uniref:xyloside xylosyltransferase 1 n=1 Tax=Phalacrocorax aristotelis TaxID=126867 RepID=UPI003F4C5D7F